MEAVSACGLLDLPRTSANARIVSVQMSHSGVANLAICVSIGTHLINVSVSFTLPHFPLL